MLLKLRKYILLLSVVALIGLVSLYGFSQFALWYLKDTCQNYFGLTLAYDNVTKDSDGWLLEGVTLTHCQGERCASFDHVKIDYTLDIWNRHLHAIVTIPTLVWHLDAPPLDLGTVVESLETRTSFISLTGSLTILHGTLSDKEGDTEFALQSDFNGEDRFSLLATLKGELSQSGHLTLKKDKERWLAGLVFQEMPIKRLFNMAKPLSKDLSFWTILKGSITSNLSIDTDKIDAPIDGVLVLNDLSSQQASKGIEVSFKKIEITPSSPVARFSSGLIEIGKGSSTPWRVENLNGTMAQEDNGYFLHLDGYCQNAFRPTEISLTGEARFNNPGHRLLDLTLAFQGDSSARFILRQVERMENSVEVDVRHFGPREFSLLRHLLPHKNPLLDSFTLQRGDVALQAHAYFAKGWPSDIQVTHFDATHLKIDMPWDVYGEFEAIRGSFKGDASSRDFLKTITGDISVQNGRLYSDAQLEENLPFAFDRFNAQLHLSKGLMKQSHIEGEFAGLKGSASIDCQGEGKWMSLAFTGGTHDLAELLPDPIKAKFAHTFGKDTIAIAATASTENNLISVEGAANFYQGDHSGDFIDFDFAFDWPKDLLEAASLTIPDIHFKTEGLPLEKYLFPFAFDEDKLFLKGYMDASAVFSKGILKLDYNARQFVVEHEGYTIDIAEIASKNGYAASHIFNFNDFSHHGLIPVQEGRYFLKKNQLTFFPVKCQIELEGLHLHVQDIQSTCEGVRLGGQVDIDLSSPNEGEFSVVMTVPTFAGEVKHIQNLFQHFKKPFFFLKIPLEGTIAFRDKGGLLKMDFFSDDYTLETQFQGHLFNGAFQLEDAHLSLQEFSFNFDYDHQANTLLFDDIQGAVFVGPPHHQEEYALGAHNIFFSNYNTNQTAFDVWLNDAKHEVLRITGQTTFEKESSLLRFDFDLAHTHFGDVRPESLRLALDSKSSVHEFKLHSQFELQTLFADLLRFSKTGLLFLSRNVLTKLQNFQTVQGVFELDVDYDPLTSTVLFRTEGNRVRLNDKQFDILSLNGKLKGGIWTIEQLQINQMSFAADFYQKNTDWKVNFIGARLGESVLLGLEGDVSDTGEFIGKINLLEVDTEKLNEWPSIKDALQGQQLSGHFKGNGPIKISLDGEIDALLSSSIRDFKLHGLRFSDADNISCHVTSKGISFRHIDTALMGPTNFVLTKLQIGRLYLDRKNELFEVERLDFSIPGNQLSLTADAFTHSFPTLFTDTLANLMRTALPQGPLIGSVDQYNSATNAFKITFKGGDYQLFGHSHHMADINLSYTPEELNVSTSYTFNSHPYNLDLKAGLIPTTEGMLTVQSALTANPMKIQWALDEHNLLKIKQIQGELPGLSMRFHHVPSSDSIALNGDVWLNGHLLAPLLSEETNAALSKWGIGKGYRLNGTLTFLPAQDSFTPSFEGTFLGEDFEFKSYRFQELTSTVSIQPQTLYCTQTLAYDPAGRFDLGTIELRKNAQDLWNLSIPTIQVNDLRPALLKGDSETPPGHKQKALVIQTIDVKNLNGILSDPNSFVSSGSIKFANPQRKNLPNILFAIPAELLSRIGLDLSMLTPVSGNIDFEMEEGKIALKEFRDVYSDGKISKFFLANEGCYIDLEGNINVQVRLKQSNVLLKLAELFTISIQGTLKKPSYTILRPKNISGKSDELVER